MQHFVMAGRDIHIARSSSSDTGLCGAVGDYGGGSFTVSNCPVCISIDQRRMGQTAHGESTTEGV